MKRSRKKGNLKLVRDDKKKDLPIGVDLFDFEPDYTKTPEENEKMWKKKYKEVYGEDPPE
jgi:hypothetical protein